MGELILPANPIFYSGPDIQQLALEKKITVASEVSQLLTMHKEHMLQFSPSELVKKFMNPGDAVVILD